MISYGIIDLCSYKLILFDGIIAKFHILVLKYYFKLNAFSCGYVVLCFVILTEVIFDAYHNSLPTKMILEAS